MAGNLKQIKIFLASPSGLERLRDYVVKEVETYSKLEAKQRGVIFETVRCEEIYKGLGNPQEQIDKYLCGCDYYILILHKKWGSPPDINDSRYTSGSEKEFKLAWTCYKEAYPMTDMAILFKKITAKDKADPEQQQDIQKIEEFKKKIFATQKLYCENFKTYAEFEVCIRRCLSKWLRDHGRPGCIAEPKPPATVLDFFDE